jgi:hypothetical protein
LRALAPAAGTGIARIWLSSHVHSPANRPRVRRDNARYRGAFFDCGLREGVFLVSVKLILASRKAELHYRSIEARLCSIEAQLRKLGAERATPPGDARD